MDISDELQLALNRSYRLAKKSRHEFVTPEHVLLALLEYDTVGRLFEIMNISVEGFAWELESYLDQSPETVFSNGYDTFGDASAAFDLRGRFDRVGEAMGEAVPEGGLKGFFDKKKRKK